MIKDFIAVHDRAGPKEFCQKCINAFESMPTINRADHSGFPRIQQNNEIYFFQNTEDESLLSFNGQLANDFAALISGPFEEYKKEFGILDACAKFNLNPDLKIQRTLPGQGFHNFHCESASIKDARRMVLVMMYLNDCEEGGETEFLYQHQRIKPAEGRLVFCPTYWTHAHRGNPPLKGPKYMINGWLEFIS